MAKSRKTKKTSGKTSSAGSGSEKAQAERLSRSLSESAQQIWLAGVGAFGRAQVEGGKLFEGLVKEGLGMEQTARRFAGGQAEAVRDAVESTVGTARERAVGTWDRLEKVFEDRVHRALVQLGVPGREDVADLSRRIDTLTAELRRHNTGKPTAAKAARPAKKAPVRKSVAKKAVRPAARKASKASPARKAAPRSKAS